MLQKAHILLSTIFSFGMNSQEISRCSSLGISLAEPKTIRASRKRRRLSSTTRHFPSSSDTAMILLLMMSPWNGTLAFSGIRQGDPNTILPAARRQARNVPSHRLAQFAPLLASISTQQGNMDFSEPYGSTTNSLLKQILQSKQIVMDYLQGRDYQAGLDELVQIFVQVKYPLPYHESERLDSLLHSFLIQVLPHDPMLGFQAVKAYYKAANNLTKPFSCLPKRTLLDMLKALTQASCHDKDDKTLTKQCQFSQADAAYRILQRLVTSHGIRARQRTSLYEADWNRVLGTFCRDGRMHRAHQLVALHTKQEDPSISAVTFSILLQGHGQRNQYQQVLQVWKDAVDYGIVPDIVMVNTLLNALVGCDQITEARRLFQDIKSCHVGSYFRESPPAPNVRTYNTMLKGLSRLGSFKEATQLGKEMQLLGYWDFVTTNTMIHAAIAAEDYEHAESILQTNTASVPSGRKHPNVEAYTELLDAYAKSNQLDKAITTLQLMRQRNVEPTEVTYTCLVAGLGRNDKVEQALQMIQLLFSTDLRPSCVVYNALISALIEITPDNDRNDIFDARVDQALVVLKSMLQSGVRPNAATVSTIVSALGRCSMPRVDAAKLLVQQLSDQSFLVPGNSQVVAALVQTCGAGRDIAGALEAFKMLENPDTISVNAFLDASCRCGKDELAFQTFEHYFQKERLRPDVVSYTIMISSLLKETTSSSVVTAFSWYRAMKMKRNIVADTTLVDTILKSLVRIGRCRSLSKTELYFVTEVLRDADLLTWEDGQLQRRKRVVRSVFGEKLQSVWRQEYDRSSDLSPDTDELFRRKGWNQVESGFRVWGTFGKNPSASTDEFLRSKGWNDVDSGFRIL
jgi:pentatricopeptide repeat protein